MSVKMDIPFSPPDIDELEIQEVSSILHFVWITTSTETKKLESEIAE